MLSKTLKDFIDQCKAIKSDDFIKNLIKLCEDNDIYFNYERDVNGNILRIIFRIRKNKKIHPLIYYYCNGLIIDSQKWKVIALPPMAFNKRQLYNKVTSLIDYYDIFKVIDGTIVTIYYYNNKWNISSSNGYDVSSYYWMGELTYAEIIYELITKFYPELINTLEITIEDSNIHFNNLDTGYSYTIGFRHHNFHIILNDPEKIWNIQKTNIKTYDICFNEGIPGIPSQEALPKQTIDELIYTNKNSLHVAITTKETFNYGYILKSKNIEKTGELSNILISSMLLQKIKENIYEYSCPLVKKYISHKNRLEFIAIKNFFDKMDKSITLQLCPQLMSRYLFYTKLVDDIVNCIIILLKNKHTKNNIPITYDIDIVTLSNLLLNKINYFEALDPYDNNIKSILKDYVTNPEYCILFLDIICTIN
jgi:hypothetical protein